MTTDLKNREWRPVRGFEALYLVSSLGEVYSNNHFENLEWVTRSRNIIHGFENGLIKSNLTGKFGCLNSKARPVVAIKEMAIVEFGSIIECARYVGGKYNNIRSNFLNKKPFNGFQIYSL